MRAHYQRIDLKNSFGFVSLPIGYRKFKRLVDDFKQQCEQQFGQPAVLSIKLMTAPPFHQARIEPDHDRIIALENTMNESKVLCRLDSVDKLTPRLYRISNHIEVGIMPLSRAQGGPDYDAEFAGGSLQTDNNKKEINVSLQGLKSDISLSL